MVLVNEKNKKFQKKMRVKKIFRHERKKLPPSAGAFARYLSFMPSLNACPTVSPSTT